MFDVFQYSFIWVALAAGISLAIAASFISPFLVFNNQSLIADGLSHVGFTGIAIGLLFSSQPFYFAIPFTILASIVISLISGSKKVAGDTAIGIIATVSMAIGLIVISVADGFPQSISSLIMGNILTISITELVISIVAAILIVVFITLFYRKLLSLTYDQTFAQIKKIKTKILKTILAALVGLLVIVGVRTVGVLMVSALIIFPALIGNVFQKNFKGIITVGLAVSVVAVFLSIFLSHNINIPFGPTIIIFFIIVFVVMLVINFLIKRRHQNVH